MMILADSSNNSSS